MRRQHTILALLAAAQMFSMKNFKAANEITQGGYGNSLGRGGTAYKSMGTNPMFVPTRSQRIKKISKIGNVIINL